jgi:CubicO group peptidase (beta-lactamase class C family)
VATGVSGVLWPDGGRSVETHTPFDLASLTKPLVACSIARFVQGGRLGWDDPIASHVPEARGAAVGDCPLELLVAHRSGLAAHLVLGDPSGGVEWDRSAALRRCAGALRSECQGERPRTGFAPVYSDLGFILLGEALQNISGRSLDELVRDEVGAPLGLGTGSARQLEAQVPGQPLADRVAPTETLSARGGRVAGRVHDDNAWLLAGAGLSGHAGLFGTARDVAAFGMAMVDALAGRRPEWLSAVLAARLVEPRPGGSLRAGFDGKSESGSSAGPRFGAHAFGHLGFTGTSLWCDPDAAVVVALLTNRVCPTRENVLIRSIRPDVHGALFDLSARLGG